jgi:hypothetical protein
MGCGSGEVSGEVSGVYSLLQEAALVIEGGREKENMKSIRTAKHPDRIGLFFKVKTAPIATMRAASYRVLADCGSS